MIGLELDELVSERVRVCASERQRLMILCSKRSASSVHSRGEELCHRLMNWAVEIFVSSHLLDCKSWRQQQLSRTRLREKQNKSQLHSKALIVNNHAKRELLREKR